MYKFQKFKKILDKLNKLPNVVVRYSSDGINGEVVKGAKYSSTIIPFSFIKSVKVVCKAFENSGKCGKCRICWDKSVPVVAYVGHGASMKKQQRELIEAIAI